MSMTVARPKTLAQIEVMRLLAMAGIFLYHIWSELPEAGAHPVLGPVISHILSQGHVGVLLFNMITGFVLTLPYAGPSGCALPGYGTFLRHRLLRICPNYYVSLLFWSVVLVVVGGVSARLVGSLIEHLLFVHTFDPGVFFDIVPAYWWMGLLVQFYLCYPWLWRRYQRWGAARATVVLCLGCWGGWALLNLLARFLPGSCVALADYLLYFNLPYRLPEFALGMYLAVRWKDTVLPATFDHRGARDTMWLLCGGLTGLGLWGPSVSVLLVMQIYWIAICVSLALAVYFTQGAATLGAWRPLARAAAASYSFYLLHQPVISYSIPWVKTTLAPLHAFVVVTVGAGVVAYLMSLALDKVAAQLQTTSGVPR